MADEGLDVILATSRHNIQYLSGGHRSLFFDRLETIGSRRYTPALLYPIGRPDLACYIGDDLERDQLASQPIWVGDILFASGAAEAMGRAADRVRLLNGRLPIVGVESAFISMEASVELRRRLPHASLRDSASALERLRACKRPEELEMMRQAAERVLASMMAVFAAQGENPSTAEIFQALRLEEIKRDLSFEYCLVAVGASHCRAPSQRRWRSGEILSLDSGGSFHGYVGDLARMAVDGLPDSELVDLLAQLEAVQQAARQAVLPGAVGPNIFLAAEVALAATAHHEWTSFSAHGTGLVAHEAPRLSPVHPCEGEFEPLRPGMVLSIETSIHHPKRGFLKLEDTLAVTSEGHVAFGDRARGWNCKGFLVEAISRDIAP